MVRACGGTFVASGQATCSKDVGAFFASVIQQVNVLVVGFV